MNPDQEWQQKVQLRQLYGQNGIIGLIGHSPYPNPLMWAVNDRKHDYFVDNDMDTGQQQALSLFFLSFSAITTKLLCVFSAR